MVFSTGVCETSILTVDNLFTWKKTCTAVNWEFLTNHCLKYTYNLKPGDLLLRFSRQLHILVEHNICIYLGIFLSTLCPPWRKGKKEVLQNLTFCYWHLLPGSSRNSMWPWEIFLPDFKKIGRAGFLARICVENIQLTFKFPHLSVTFDLSFHDITMPNWHSN